MKPLIKTIESLLNAYGIKEQKNILHLISQNVPVVKMGQTSIIIENVHIHPHGINRSLKYHQHHFTEIHVPYDGAGFVDAEGAKHHFQLGEFTLNRPEQIHYWEMTKAPLPMLVLWMRLEHQPEDPKPMDQLLIDFFAAKKIIHPLPDDFFSLYSGLLAEAATPRTGLESALRNYLSQIILTLARATATPRKLEQKIQIEPRTRDERLVFMVNQFLRLNLANELRLEDIARQISLSTRSLTRKYREIEGRSIGEELNGMRMYHAEELLRESDLPIKAIAWECGVPDQCYFTRKFKEFHGDNPSNYRRKIVPSQKGFQTLENP